MDTIGFKTADFQRDLTSVLTKAEEYHTLYGTIVTGLLRQLSDLNQSNFTSDPCLGHSEVDFSYRHRYRDMAGRICDVLYLLLNGQSGITMDGIHRERIIKITWWISAREDEPPPDYGLEAVLDPLRGDIQYHAMTDNRVTGSYDIRTVLEDMVLTEADEAQMIKFMLASARPGLRRDGIGTRLGVFIRTDLFLFKGSKNRE